MGIYIYIFVFPSITTLKAVHTEILLGHVFRHLPGLDLLNVIKNVCVI